MPRRLYVTLVLGLLLMEALAQGATADPINAKNATTFTASCDGQEVELVVDGAGSFTPAHVVGSTAVFVPEVLTSPSPSPLRPGRARPRPSPQPRGTPKAMSPATSTSPKPRRREPSL